MAIKKPYLIQRGRINHYDKTLNLFQAASIEYMGGAEFEFGALPESLMRIEKDFKLFSLFKVKEIVKENCLYMFGNFSSKEEKQKYINYLVDLHENKIKAKEITSFPKSYLYGSDNFWWDIRNDTMFSYDQEFMESLKFFLQSSFDYMNKKV